MSASLRSLIRIAIMLVILAAGVLGCQDGGSPGPRRPPPPEEGEPAGEIRMCQGNFLAHRQDDRFYNARSNRQIPRKRACADPIVLPVPERISIPIYWARVGGQWSDPKSIPRKLQETSSWFERYCIRLNFQEIPLRAVEAQTIARSLSQADAVSPDKHREEVGGIYPQLWRRAGRPRDLLLILFVDSFRNVRYGERVDRVAGNFDKMPVILIPGDPDARSSHIVTHELIHGLGKLRSDDSTPPGTRVPGSGEDRINTWDEGGCTTDMGNAGRSEPAAPLIKPDDHLLDWASYYQFLNRANTIK